MYPSFVFLLVLILSGCQGWSTRQNTPVHLDKSTQNLPVYKVILTLNDFHFVLEIQKQPTKSSTISETLVSDEELGSKPETNPETNPDNNPDTKPDTKPDTNSETKPFPEESLSPFPGTDDEWMILPDL